ncbi:MAG: ABC transporter substrate-binding protein, partial [Candidatus Ornithospirochaeta sp.]
MKKAKRIISVFMMLALVAVAVFAQGAEETGTTKKDVINVIYHPTVGGSTTIATAINKGFFEEENLDVKLQMYTSGPPEIAAMVAGQADFGFIGSGAAWLAFSGQVDIIALDNMALTEEIIARTGRGIEKIEDLKGKTIAVQ